MHKRIWLGLVVLWGCAAPVYSGPGGGEYSAGSYPGGSGGQVGATVGGQKDLGQARAAVAAGGVPTAASIAVEGLLAEHDFETEGDPCTDRFCARPAAARVKS